MSGMFYARLDTGNSDEEQDDEWEQARKRVVPGQTTTTGQAGGAAQGNVPGSQKSEIRNAVHSTDGAKHSAAHAHSASTPAMSNLIDFGDEPDDNASDNAHSGAAGLSGTGRGAADVFDPFADVAGASPQVSQKGNHTQYTGSEILHISGAASAPVSPHRDSDEKNDAQGRGTDPSEEDESAGPSTPGHDVNCKRELVRVHTYRTQSQFARAC